MSREAKDELREVEKSEPKPLAPKATLCGTRGLRFRAKHAVSAKLLGRRLREAVVRGARRVSHDKSKNAKLKKGERVRERESPHLTSWTSYI